MRFITTVFLFLLYTPDASANHHPECPDERYFTTVGSDGIRYGWYQNTTCEFPAGSLPSSVVANQSGSGAAESRHPVCPGERYFTSVGSDGIRYGWYQNASCVFANGSSQVAPAASTATANNSRHPVCPSERYFTSEGNDGIRYGWFQNASCIFDTAAAQSSTDSLATGGVMRRETGLSDNCQVSGAGNSHITELVTDVFLTAGQSNATGHSTQYQPEDFETDRVNSRLIVWTEDNKWEVANPESQTWHDGRYPHSGSIFFNHPAFQIGRAIANLDECRVVAFIATAATGRPIDYWRNNTNNHYTDIGTTVTEALNALPGKHAVDMIWWMQGEADDDQIVDRYFNKLTDLIARFRSENWFGASGYFLANETGWFTYANRAIRRLRTDNDPYSDYSRGEDSPADPFPHLPSTGGNRVHFNAVALRKIGDLVASKYLFDYLR